LSNAPRRTPRSTDPASPASERESGTGSAVTRTSTGRAGRRTRSRPGVGQRSPLQRFRGPLIALAAVLAFGLIGAWVFVGATSRTYACVTIFNPSPTPSAEPSETARMGYVQRNQGNRHDPETPNRYLECPPATGRHKNVQGSGPILSRVYGPDDFIEPQGWIHNLEHGALVVLYRCDASAGGADPCGEAGQSALRDYYSVFPNSPRCNLAKGGETPVFARFDDMAWPYAAIVWGRVLPLQTLDTAAISEFYRLEGERTNPEDRCPGVSPTPDPNATPTPTPSVAPSGSAVPSGSAAPSSSAAPSGSVAPSPAGS
jgi:hypothetical protein